MKTATYTFDEVVAYLASWRGELSNLNELTYNEVCAMIKNAAACVECGSDGIGNRPTELWQAQVREKEA